MYIFSVSNITIPLDIYIFNQIIEKCMRIQDNFKYRDIPQGRKMRSSHEGWGLKCTHNIWGDQQRI